MFKKSFRLVTLPITLFILMALSTVRVEAISFDNLKIDVYLNDDGSAQIKETWQVTVEDSDDHTELYKPLELEDDQEMLNYQVSMNDQELDYEEDWNVDASREEKAGHYGFNNQEELNIGIGDSGSNTYVFDYTVSNFVMNTEDSQMIYWQFVNDSMDPAPAQASIRINTDTIPLDQDQVKIWGFGYEGEATFLDNELVFETASSLTEDNYMVSLVYFPAATFNSTVKVDGSFDEWQERAFEGSDYETSDPPVLLILIGAISLVLLVIWVVVYVSSTEKYGLSGVPFKKRGKAKKISKTYYPRVSDLEKRFDEMYYRDIITTDVYKLSEMVHRMLRSQDTTINNYLLVTILYLVMTESISIEGKGKKATLTFHDLDPDLPDRAKRLYAILNDYAVEKTVSVNGLVKSIEYKKLKNWEIKSRQDSKAYLIDQAYASQPLSRTDNDSDEEILLKQIEQNFGIQYTREGHELRDNLYKYVEYLKDFSLVDERQTIEVRVYNYMMIYAALFGELDTVKKELSHLTVERLEEAQSYGSTYRPMVILTPGMLNSAAYTSNTFYNSSKGSPGASSGMGGSSSLGGGGGSFGGGSGGGAR